MDSGIYCIENLTTHKKYIGQSNNIPYRIKQHLYELRNNKHYNAYLQKAWNKYGEEDFNIYVVEYCDIKDLDEKERFFIAQYNTTDNQYGYNMTHGGQDGAICVGEAAERRRASLRKYYETTNAREIRGQQSRERFKNPEYAVRFQGENHPNYGHHLSEEAKKRIGEANKGRVCHKRNFTPVYCVELDKEFIDAWTASQELNIDSSGILKVCRGDRFKCGGYHWRFIENNNGK